MTTMLLDGVILFLLALVGKEIVFNREYGKHP